MPLSAPYQTSLPPLLRWLDRYALAILLLAGMIGTPLVLRFVQSRSAIEDQLRAGPVPVVVRQGSPYELQSTYSVSYGKLEALSSAEIDALRSLGSSQLLQKFEQLKSRRGQDRLYVLVEVRRELSSVIGTIPADEMNAIRSDPQLLADYTRVSAEAATSSANSALWGIRRVARLKVAAR